MLSCGCSLVGETPPHAKIYDTARGFLDTQRQVSTGGTFTTYCISTVGLKFASFDEEDLQISIKPIEVRRRYSDFALLRSYLEREYPFGLIPPIPEKHSAIGTIFFSSPMFGGTPSNRMDGDAIIEYRVRAFTSFLGHLLSGSLFINDHILHIFLSDPCPTLWRNNLGTLSSVPSRSLNVVPRNADPRIIELHSHILPAMEKSIIEFETLQRQVLSCLRDIGQSTEKLGSEYNAFALEYLPLADILEKTGEAHDQISEKLQPVLLSHQYLCERIHELSGYIPAIKTAVLNYMVLEASFESATEQLNKARSHLLKPRSLVSYTTKNQEDEALITLERSANIFKHQVLEKRDCLVDQLAIWLKLMQSTWNECITTLVHSQRNFDENSVQIWLSWTKSIPENSLLNIKH